MDEEEIGGIAVDDLTEPESQRRSHFRKDGHIAVDEAVVLIRRAVLGIVTDSTGLPSARGENAPMRQHARAQVRARDGCIRDVATTFLRRGNIGENIRYRFTCSPQWSLLRRYRQSCAGEAAVP